MKKIVILMILMMSVICQAKMIAPMNPQPRGVRAESIGFKNCIYTSPNNLIADYTNIKSSNWDTQWGALSSTNWRCLVLTPGTYNLSSTLTLDTNFVAVVSESDDPNDTIVVRGAGGETVNQTANTIFLRGFTIKNTGATNNAFIQSATDNSKSIYRFMNFIGNGGSYNYSPVYGVENIRGTWENCNATKYAWRIASNKQLSAYMYRCVSWDTIYKLSSGYGTYSFGGDEINAPVTGIFIECKTGDYGFGGCSTFGNNVSGILISCEAGNNSYAIGANFSGTAIDCAGGMNCFGGHTAGLANYGTFSGYAERCTVKGGDSFGVGAADCVQSGIIKECRYGSIGQYAGGRSIVKTSTVTNNGAKASLTTNLTGSNNDLVYTAREYGTGGNDVSIRYLAAGSAGTITITFKAISIRIKNDGTTTATQVKDWLNANSLVMDLILPITNAPENDGSGTIPAAGMVATNLSGGVNPVWFQDNAPYIPIANTANFNVYAFDNGAIYTNTGATGTVIGILPSALVGLKYTFADTNNAAGNDISIDPYSTGDFIRKNDGTVLSGGEIYEMTTDSYNEITLECKEPNYWMVTNIAPKLEADCRVSTQFDKTNDTNLANIPGLSATLIAGQTYSFQAILFVTAGTNGNSKYAVSGTCTATSIVYDITVITGAHTSLTRATALDVSGYNSSVGSLQATITGTITVNAGGTLTIQFAQWASSSNTSSTLVGSYMIVRKY